MLKSKKNGLKPADKISLYFPSIKMFRFFPKGERSYELLLFHKMLEGLCIVFADFDERTTDDWDVDMSVYYEPGAGDKDARDFVTMREEAMLRSGRKDPVIDKTCIGQFEKFSKVRVILGHSRKAETVLCVKYSNHTLMFQSVFAMIAFFFYISACLLYQSVNQARHMYCFHYILGANVSCKMYAVLATSFVYANVLWSYNSAIHPKIVCCII